MVKILRDLHPQGDISSDSAFLLLYQFIFYFPVIWYLRIYGTAFGLIPQRWLSWPTPNWKNCCYSELTPQDTCCFADPLWRTSWRTSLTFIKCGLPDLTYWLVRVSETGRTQQGPEFVILRWFCWQDRRHSDLFPNYMYVQPPKPEANNSTESTELGLWEQV